MSRTRRILLLAALVPVLLLGAVAAAALLIPRDRVAAVVASRAESILGARVRLDDIGLRFLPLPGVRLGGVSVGGDSDSTALAVLDAVELRARLLPLLRGQVVLDRLALDRPRILLEVDSAGELNLPILQGDTAGATDGPGRDIRFEIDRIDVTDGRIGYRDTRDGAILRLDGWNQRLRLSGDVEAGELARVSLEGTLSFEDIDARLPDVVVPVRDLALRVTHDATLDRARDRLDLRDLAVVVDGITLTGNGTVDSLSSATGRAVALTLDADGLDAGELVRWVPDSLRSRLALPDGRPLDIAGTGTMHVRVDGPLTADARPAVDGSLTLTGVTVDVDGQALLADVRGESTFSTDSLLVRLNGRALGEPFTAGFAVRDPTAPAAVVAFTGRAELARLAALGFVPDSLGLDGAVSADVQARVPLRNLPASQAVGTVELSGIRVAGMEPSIALSAATVQLQGERVRIEPLPLRIGDAGVPVTINVAAEGWIPALLDSAAAPPRVVAVVRSDSLDLDALAGPSESQYPPLLFARLRDRPIDGRTAAEVAQEAGLRLPALPRVDAEVRALVGRLVRNGLEYRDLDASVRTSPTAVQLEYARFVLMGGAVQLSGRLDIVETDSAGTPIAARVAGEYAMGDVQAGPFFDRLTPFRDHLAGELGMAGSFGFRLDRNALPVRDAVSGSGTLAIASGRLANWRVLQALGTRLDLPAYDTIRFQDWAGRFNVTGSLVTLDETALDGQEIDARAAGSFDFGGALDLGATVYLSRDLATRAGQIGDQVASLASADGRIPIGVRITGTAEDPQIGIDLSEARANVVGRARETAQREAEALAQRAAGQVADRLEIPDSLRGLPPDSLRAILGDSLFSRLPDSLRVGDDSLRSRVEESLRQRVIRLLPGRTARPDTAPPDTGGTGGGGERR